MIDILPRFKILQQNQISLESIDYFLINSRQKKFQQETLDKLGIPANKFIESDQLSHLQASTLIVPDFPAYTGWTVPSTIQFLRYLFHPKIQTQKQYPKRIYISRNRARYRRVLNESEVINFLSPFGFYAFEMESLSVQEQANVFANAEMIIAPHGAGLTNLVFCQPQTTVVELVSPHYIRHYYGVISQQLGLKHYTLQAEALGCSFLRNLMYPNPSFEDLWISIESLERLQKILNLVSSD
jgi:capsular polysaccharide biosynthesis protein